MLRLRYHGTSPIPIEADCLTPDNLAGKSLAEIAALPVQHGNRTEPLGAFFDIDGDSADREIRIDGDCSKVKRIGLAMNSGRIVASGNVGMHVGAELSGGELVVEGDASDWIGAEMTGGRIHVHGSAGNLAGAAYRGSRRGMRGGVLLIDGNAGRELGATLRRGLIAVGGSVGDFAGANLIAGSIFLFGRPGVRFGAGMKRGTVALLGESAEVLPTFAAACDYAPVFLSLYLRKLAAWGFGPAAAAGRAVRCRRYVGDLASLGKGEILIRRE
jgi:formylmethanofuran dehydrogenase subunit C